MSLDTIWRVAALILAAMVLLEEIAELWTAPDAEPSQISLRAAPDATPSQISLRITLSHNDPTCQTKEALYIADK